MRSVVLIVIVAIGMSLGLVEPLQALSVGNITLQSHRGEPFKAEVAFTLEAQERGKSFEVTIGGAKEYRLEDLTRAAWIDALQVTASTNAPETIRIMSQQPITEPGFDLLLLVRSGKLTIVRNYHVDLPEPAPAPAPLVIARASPATPLVVPASTAPAPGRHITVVTAPPAPSPPAPSPPSPRSGLPKRYGPVKSGDTLYGIVRNIGVPQEKIWQAIILIWRANHDQFSRGNMHGMRIATYLDIPPHLLAQLNTLGLKESQQVVSEQWEAWQNRQTTTTEQAQAMAAASAAPETAAAKAQPAPSPTAPGSGQQPGAVSAPQAAATPAAAPVTPPATVLLPTDKASSLVSVADLQELLQGLEERITQRLSPLQRPLQPSKESVAFVSASELQSTLQTLEQRLTRRVEQMLVHNGIAVPMAPVANQTVPQAQSPMVATAPPVAVARASYALLLVNLLLFLFGVALLWRWWQHLSADERRTKLATWRAHVARQSARIPRFGSRSHR